MLKEEFENLVGKPVDDKDYSKIETVYTFHPSISNVSGKREIAELYKNYGMRVINDMYKTAKIAKELDKRIQTLKYWQETYRTYYQELAKGGEINLKELQDTIIL